MASRRSAVTAPSKVWVCGPSLAGIAGSNATEGMDILRMSVVIVVCYQVEISATS